MKYDYPNGYAVKLANGTKEHILTKKNGRTKLRYDIVLCDRVLTPVHENIKLGKVKEIKKEIERQGNKLL